MSSPPAPSRSSLLIRPALRDDLPAVRDLLVETWHDAYDALMGPARVAAITERWHSIDNLARGLHRPGHGFWVAEADGALAGTVSATRHDDESVVLDRIYVRPAYQRAGIGRTLLDAVAAGFPGARAVRLHVEAGNANGRAFYERNGFAWTGERRQDEAGEALVYERRGDDVRRLGALIVRPARNDDAQDLFGLLALCFAEYPGCYIDPHQDLTDLRDVQTAFAAAGGAFFVVEDPRGRVCACVAVDYPAPAQAELHRLYVRPDARRRGLASRLVRLVEDHARGRHAATLFFWSDTRFTEAHRLYAALGYRRGEGTRALGDVSGSVEYRFEKALG